MNVSRPATYRYCRHILVVTGIAILVWSGLEDSDALAVTILGGVAAAASTMFLLSTRLPRLLVNARNRLPIAALAGLWAGGLTAVITQALMLFKNVRHGHINPDYPPQMILAILERLPLWVLAGGLAGIGIGILLKLRANRRATGEKT